MQLHGVTISHGWKPRRNLCRLRQGNNQYWRQERQCRERIVVAGNSFFDSNNSDFAVVRYNANGTLDPSFNKNGKATADFGANDHGHSVAVHGDGRIVVAGYTTTETKEECALACFKANGSLDTSFNGTGKVTTNFGGDGNAEGQSVAMQIDGKIIVVGFATVAAVQQFAVARYNADGTLDTSFGGTGRVVTAVGISGSNATGVALQNMTLRVCAITLMEALTKVSAITARWPRSLARATARPTW